MVRLFRALLLLSLALPLTAADQIDAQIAAMSEREKVAQLLLVGFDGKVATSDLRRLIVEWRVGGVVLYRHNIGSPQDVRDLNRAIVKLAEPSPPPFIAVDQEGGEVRRLEEDVPLIPSAMAIGATRSEDLSRRAGRAVGAALRDLGFNMNFAPVLDVLGERENPALLTRAFSDDPDLVASLGSAFAEGTWEAGVIPVGKHYPGQGRVTADSHHELPAIDGDIATLRRHDLRPFNRAFAKGVPAVMTGHVAVPMVAETARTPATLSRRLLSDILRRDLRFDGLVITDDLQMSGVRRQGDSGEVAIQSVLAGADMIMVAWNRGDRERILKALEGAYSSGRISESRMRQSLRRILALKHRLALVQPQVVDEGDIAAEIARRSVTVLHSDDLPLRDLKDLAVLGPDGPLRHRLAAARWFPTPPRVDDQITQRALESIGAARTIVAVLSTPADFLLAAAVRKHLPERRFVIVSLGSPWKARVEPQATTTILAYSAALASQEAAADVLTGKIAPIGSLPVLIKVLE